MKSAYFLVSVAATLVVGSLASCGGDDSETATSGLSQGGGTTTSGNPTSSGNGAGPGSGGASTSTGSTSSTGSGATGAGGTGGGTPSMIDCSAPSGAVPQLKLTLVTSALDNPLLAKAAPDDPDRLYVIQQHGEIMIVENGQVLPTPFLDASNLIIAGGEQGLLGLAFHPNYAQNGRFFIHYSANGTGESTIQEYKRSASDPLVADPNPVQLVLAHDTAQSNHNGGTTEFGQDGFLYIALGDGGNQNDPECDAQNKSNLLGKISRIDVDGVPDANGYPAAPGNPDGGKYYHVGFRNPWRMSFDACTFDLYIGDVGQNSWEEVSVVSKADGPKNFGWPFREGAHNHSAGGCATNSDMLVEPFTEFVNQPGSAVIGGYVYRGSKMPGLRGTYFYGDNGVGSIWTIQWNNGSPSPATLLGISVNNLSSFGQDGHGEVYAMGLGGDLYRFEAM